MFAYCGNNPVNYCDPCGACCHRWDFWNDCEKCVDKTYEEKWNEYFAMVYDSHMMQIESQQQIDQIQMDCFGDSIAAMWDAYVQSYNRQQAAQLQDAEMLISCFSTQERAITTAKLVGSELVFIGACISGEPLTIMGSFILFAVEFFIAVG